MLCYWVCGMLLHVMLLGVWYVAEHMACCKVYGMLLCYGMLLSVWYVAECTAHC